MTTLDHAFYRRDDVVAVSRDLLGKVLCTHVDGATCKAIITETEAYDGPTDRASHAFDNRRTKRTEPLFADGGIAYVYLCYGIHHMFNVVSSVAGRPHAILVRAGYPLEGVDAMLARRDRERVDTRLMNGPGTLGQAMGIRTSMTGTDLTGDTLWIEGPGIAVVEDAVAVGPRIGIDYAGEDARLPYRFVLDSAFVEARAGEMAAC